MKNTIVFGDNLEVLRTLEGESIDLIYIDPPFNTGKLQKRSGEDGQTRSYRDTFDDLQAFLQPRLLEAYRLLKPNGSLFFHIDWRESHYCKIQLDYIFGRASFINEIIWSYDYGGRSKTKWSTKHDTIYWYAKNPAGYTFNYDAIDRIPYLAPDLVGPEKTARGKTPTTVWWNTIVPTNGKEKTGYPTQKPLGILNRIVQVHSNPGDQLLDFFAGSGSFGEAARNHGRACILIDQNPEAIAVMLRRLPTFEYGSLMKELNECE